MKGLSHEQRRQLKNHIVEYRKQNHTVNECCERFGVSRQYVTLACKGIKYNWKIDYDTMRAAAQQQAIDNARCNEEIASVVRNKTNGAFEYVGEYTGSNGAVNIRCTSCGTEYTRSWITIRHNKSKCSVCAKREREDRIQSQKRQEKEERRYQKILSMRTKQVTMNVCPVCSKVFVGKNTYCSDKCRNQNKWTMKDGYRYLFPLKEVYERDNGICYLCGCVCDWNDYTIKNGIKIYGNKYPSRDHVVPKSKGGRNEWGNIKLACRQCNSLKGIAPVSQMSG